MRHFIASYIKVASAFILLLYFTPAKAACILGPSPTCCPYKETFPLDSGGHRCYTDFSCSSSLQTIHDISNIYGCVGLCGTALYNTVDSSCIMNDPWCTSCGGAAPEFPSHFQPLWLVAGILGVGYFFYRKRQRKAKA